MTRFFIIRLHFSSVSAEVFRNEGFYLTRLLTTPKTSAALIARAISDNIANSLKNVQNIEPSELFINQKSSKISKLREIDIIFKYTFSKNTYKLTSKPLSEAGADLSVMAKVHPLIVVNIQRFQTLLYTSFAPSAG